MKKKKTIYLLLPVILVVWGFVFFQLFSYFFSSPNYAKKEEKTVASIDEIKKDTFSIVANYRDPFLGKKVKVKSKIRFAQNTKSSNSKQTNTNKTTSLEWPVIQYKGMIKNNNAQRRVGIVNIGNQEFLIKEGNVINEVKFITINKNFIKVRFQKEQKTIAK